MPTTTRRIHVQILLVVRRGVQSLNTSSTYAMIVDTESIMPLYEYHCKTCKRRVTLLRSFSDTSTPRCPQCQSENLVRLVSRVSVLKSEESRLESLADPSSLAGLDENDPRSIARWMRKMSEETGEDMGPEFNEMVGRLEAGESTEAIEESMGELGEEGIGDYGI
jgi:putative FmdB family regulatory protein